MTSTEQTAASEELTFDLLEREWVPCLLQSGKLEMLSLTAAFHRAHEVREISGELPTQDFAILRLMLAVMYGAIGHDFTVSEWQEWWSSGLPLQDIGDYLRDYPDAFDLLHPERPFFQTAGLHTSKNEVKAPELLIFDVPSKEQKYFSMRGGSELGSLSLAESARWLISLHAFDFAGIKSGAVGDPRVRGGKGYGIGTGWAGRLGGVVFEGSTLAETLLLNFVPSSDYTDTWDRDAPAWERELPSTATTRRVPDSYEPGGTEDPEPHGPADLYTWQSRRVRLRVERGRVTGVVLAQGDPASPQNRHGLEPMSAWRYSEPQSKKFKRDVYMPREHRAERAFWRGIAGLVPELGVNGIGKNARRFLAPGTSFWLSRLQSSGVLAPDHAISVRAIGVVYGSNESVIDDVIHDRLLVPLALLRAEHPDLKHLADSAVQLTESGVRALKIFAGDLAAAAGGDQDGPRERAESQGFAAIDLPFRQWLRQLATGVNAQAMLDRWKISLHEILTNLGRELAEAAGPAAITGRKIAGFNGLKLLTKARAEYRYDAELRKLLTASARDAEAPNESSTE